jgi:hypothetical protein
MAKFKVGDRVRCLYDYNGDGPNKGWTGTVREIEAFDAIIVTWDGYGVRNKFDDWADENVIEHIVEKPPIQSLKDRIVKAATISPEAQKALSEVFPEWVVPPEPEYVEFKDGDQISSLHFTRGCIFIGKTYAPEGLSTKCLMWHKSNYEAEIGEHEGYGYIAFKKLKATRPT